MNIELLSIGDELLIGQTINIEESSEFDIGKRK
jgi:molybdopterin-biosynthesis enzyme MoeA-like protein